MTIALSIRGVTLGYDDHDVVSGLDLDIAPGEVVSVLGSSGCGKSTLLRALAGLKPVRRGELLADGVPVRGPGRERALMFQDDALLPWRTVLQNVELPLTLEGVPRVERRERAKQWLTRVGLRHAESKLPKELSGGMRQRTQLARSLAGAPGAILMDEPFGALDAQTRATMQRVLIDALADTAATVVFVTHDVDEALALGDRVVVIGSHGVTASVSVPQPRQADRPAPTTERQRLWDALHDDVRAAA